MKKENNKNKLLDIIPDAPQTDWEQIRGIFKHEKDYITGLIDEIVEDINISGSPEYKNDFPRSLKVILGPEADEFNADYFLPLRHIQSSFLKFLEYRGVILNLVFENEMSVDEIDGSSQSYAVANFVVKRPTEFNSEARRSIKNFVENDTEKSRSVEKITFTDKQLCWKNMKIPFKRGYSSVISELLKKPTVFMNGKKIKDGESLHRKKLEEFGPYTDEKSFRYALKEIRKKLKIYGFPVAIENPKTNHYLMVIRYLN